MLGVDRSDPGHLHGIAKAIGNALSPGGELGPRPLEAMVRMRNEP